MSATPSPITPTSDQADTIVQLLAYAAMHGVNVDAGPLDCDATEGCWNDWHHGPGVVCLPHDPDRLCVTCGMDWLWWHRRSYRAYPVALDVLRVPATDTETRAVA